MKNSIDYTFSYYVDQLLHTTDNLLNIDVEPRIGLEIQRIMHLSEKTKTRDWYLYQNYTEIRIYVCELPPYRLPKFVPMRIVSLEYIR